eukprot:scaffold1781_cov371-Pinguiococcus_pyrenoidosus.AAC.8
MNVCQKIFENPKIKRMIMIRRMGSKAGDVRFRFGNVCQFQQPQERGAAAAPAGGHAGPRARQGPRAASGRREWQADDEVAGHRGCPEVAFPKPARGMWGPGGLN